MVTTRISTLVIAGLLATLAVANTSSAGLILMIDDTVDGALSQTLTGAVVDSSLQVTQEGIGVLGLADAHIEYITADPNAPLNGQTFVYNYNLYEPGHVGQAAFISDTLNIVVTGHEPAFAGDANVSIDLHFRSDSLDGVLPGPLYNGIAQAELAPYNEYQPLSDFTVRAASAVPEPGSLTLLGLGLVSIGGGVAWKKRKAPSAV